MIRRLVSKLLPRRLAAYPAVALVGPRQCGKTTLAKSLGGAYFDLEQEQDRLRLDLEWERRVSGKDLLILDEAQAWPGIFERLRGEIDRRRSRAGRFLLLGSVSPSLMKQVSESLTGRLALIEMTPFLIRELPAKSSGAALWLRGGFPDGGIISPASYPHWQKSYLSLLTQRDLPNWGLSAKPQAMDRLLRMLAAVNGQAWNASQIGQSLGLSYHTINGYLDFLAGAFLVRRLFPYLPNMRKRLIKSPKVYFRDTGLLHALLNIPDQNSLLNQPWVGASWEGFVIEQTLGTLTASGAAFDAYYLRTSDQYEADLVLDFGRERWAIEIKLTASPNLRDMERLNRASDLIGASRCFLVSKTTRETGARDRLSCGLPYFLNLLV